MQDLTPQTWFDFHLNLRLRDMKNLILYTSITWVLVGCGATDNRTYVGGDYSSRSAGIDEVLKQYGASQSPDLYSPNPSRDRALSQRSTDLTLDEILKLQQIVNNAFGSRQSRLTTSTSREQLSCTQNGWLLQCNRGREQVSCTRNGWLIQCNDGTSCNINGNVVTCNK